jgi:hypothetical protein
MTTLVRANTSALPGLWDDGVEIGKYDAELG